MVSSDTGKSRACVIAGPALTVPGPLGCPPARDGAPCPPVLRLPGVPPQLSRRRRLAILSSCCFAVLVVQIDSTGVNLALPSISRELGASTGQLQWVVDAYVLVLASLMMFSGSLADRVGRRRIFLLGLVLFGIGSALCSASAGPVMLIGMRALQAVGGSMLGPVALSIISGTFPDPRERAQAIGVWGAVVGLGMALGPLVGGILVSAVDWRAVFWINLPLVVIAVPLIHAVVPESHAPKGRRMDIPGQVLAVLTLGCLTYAIIEAGEQSVGHVRATGFLAAAVVAGAVFVAVERREAEPLLELRFFRSLPFSLATVMALLLFFSYAGFVFVATLYLQDARGLTPLHAGLVTLPMALTNAAMAPVSGWLVGHLGTRIPMLAGAVSLAAGALMLLQLGQDTPLPWFIGAGMFMGGAMGTINTPISNTAVSGMPPDRAGVAGATASTARQVGQALGVAVLGAALNTHLSDGQPFTSAALPGWWMVLIMAVLIGVMAVASNTTRAQASAHAAHQGW